MAATAARDYTGPEFDIRVGPLSEPLACSPVRAYRLPDSLKNVARVVVACERAFVAGRKASRAGQVSLGGAKFCMQTVELRPGAVAAGEISMVRIDGHPDDTVRFFVIAATK